MSDNGVTTIGIDNRTRERLAALCVHYKRTVKAQVDVLVEDECKRVDAQAASSALPPEELTE